eukprot:5673161-Pyramimonas_sp.AAC.1
MHRSSLPSPPGPHPHAPRRGKSGAAALPKRDSAAGAGLRIPRIVAGGRGLIARVRSDGDVRGSRVAMRGGGGPYFRTNNAGCDARVSSCSLVARDTCNGYQDTKTSKNNCNQSSSPSLPPHPHHHPPSSSSSSWLEAHPELTGRVQEGPSEFEGRVQEVHTKNKSSVQEASPELTVRVQEASPELTGS